jgi:transposase
MLNLEGRRVFLARAAVDMRKSYQTLADVVRLQMDLDPLSGDVFIFIGKDRSRVKVLVWDASGFWVCAKRLEGSRFAVPQGCGLPSGVTGSLPLTMQEVSVVLAGIRMTAPTSRRHALFNERC